MSSDWSGASSRMSGSGAEVRRALAGERQVQAEQACQHKEGGEHDEADKHRQHHGQKEPAAKLEAIPDVDGQWHVDQLPLRRRDRPHRRYRTGGLGDNRSRPKQCLVWLCCGRGLGLR